MTPKTPTAAVRLDRDRHHAWLAARDEARIALDAWWSAPLEDKRDAYAVYRAAADREDAAARWLMHAG